MKTFIIILLIIIAGLAIYYAIGTSQNNAALDNMDAGMHASGSPAVSAAPSESQEGIQAGIETDIEISGDTVKEFVIQGSNFRFSPNQIRVQEGDRVRIIFKSEGGMHDFMLDEFNVQTKTVQSGEEDTVEFLADKKGTFEFYCSIGDHRAMGMVGTFIVE